MEWQSLSALLNRDVLFSILFGAATAGIAYRLLTPGLRCAIHFADSLILARANLYETNSFFDANHRITASFTKIIEEEQKGGSVASNKEIY